jgi:predicted O-linked N-acetylglucosamine transferase (SPINDLY family)
VDVKSLPAQQNGYVTFGCFNRLLKMTDENVSVRARVLNSIPKSKLFLKDSQLQHQTVRDQIICKFEKYGISEDQLILEGSSPRKEYLECYNRVDIVLSPYPYGGGTTNVEALWMGVPAIIKRGDYLLSHLGETIANNAGLTNWIANDEDDYVAKAIKFSSNLDDLGKLRQGLRKQVLTSSLLNPKKFTKHFETALWGMWKKLQTENKNV